MKNIKADIGLGLILKNYGHGPRSTSLETTFKQFGKSKKIYLNC